MAMHDIEKAVREIIRSVMREKGLKHHSKPNEISTVCYASRPTHNIEYRGPTFISYHPPNIHVYTFATDKTTAAYGRHTYSYTDTTAVEIKIDIHDPNLDKILGDYLDAHIQESNKNPQNWKRLHRDEEDHYHHIEDKNTQPSQSSFWGKLKRFLFPPNKDFYWENAIQRHFKLNDQELKQVLDTVQALQTQGSTQIINDTRIIVENEDGYNEGYFQASIDHLI